MKSDNKIPVNFRFPKRILNLLRRESKKTSINQTRIVELALSQYFAVKRS